MLGSIARQRFVAYVFQKRKTIQENNIPVNYFHLEGGQRASV